MSLSSWPFFIFLPVVFIVHYLIGDRWKWAWLLAASFLFYSALKAPHLLAVLSLVIAICYGCGIAMDRSSGSGRRRLFWLGTAASLLILVLTKHLPALFSGFRSVRSSRWLIFVGVSYFVIQAVSYLADVYKGKVQAEKHLGYLALHLAFFPKLLQGPIERADHLLPQLKRPYAFDYESVRKGLVLIAWGLFKKVVVADRLALFVDPIYGDVRSFSGVALLAATYFYAVQIYCDFSGYTDIALGSARLFNIELTQNFKTPYFATSIADFWRRWHISLSTWLRDYLFLPLSNFLSRRIKSPSLYGIDSNVAIYCSSTVVTFFLAGVWHGSAWPFVLWGSMHGLYLSWSVVTRNIRKAVRKRIRRTRWASKPLVAAQTVFSFHLVVLAWIPFRAVRLSDVPRILGSITADVKNIFDIGYVRLQFRGLGLRESDLILAAALVLVVFLIDLLDFRTGDIWRRLLGSAGWVRWAVYLMIMVAILYLSPYNSANNFIYMKF